MGPREASNWLAAVVDEFNQHESRKDGAQVAGCLTSGLTTLRDALYLRVHRDVEQLIGRDSMLMPVSEFRAQHQTFREIEAYQIAESVSAVKERRYLNDAEGWYWPWLTRLRMGETGSDKEFTERTRAYLPGTSDERRRKFMNELARVLQESHEAPLVLFRLVPLAVQIATACAFGDRGTASDLRRQQTSILPAIADCRHCQGRLLECVEHCRACGNPLWKYEWLVAAD